MQAMIQYTASSMRYTLSVALDRLLRWTVTDVSTVFLFSSVDTIARLTS
jgi:hypothetical protein